VRIDRIEFAALSIPRREPFAIARGSATAADNLFVRVTCGGLVGLGNGAPSEVTREDITTAVEAAEFLGRTLPGFEFEKPRDLADRMDALVAGHPCVKAAIDIAVHDVVAREAGQPLWAHLGGSRDRMATDMTIGIMSAEDAVERARRRKAEGFRSLKVKVGTDLGSDLARVRAIREAVGPAIELRVDGNQGYGWQEALAFAKELQGLGIAFFEQPVSAADYEGMRILAESSPIPIMADEMVLTAEHVKKLRWGNAANAVNLKLMKHGGIARAAEVDTICESAGYPTMVGCMGEPQLSIAAGLHFALARKNVRWIDLDSHFNLIEDPSSGLRFEDGDLVAPKGTGLGINLKWPG